MSTTAVDSLAQFECCSRFCRYQQMALERGGRRLRQMAFEI
jgi:hypothetical protein